MTPEEVRALEELERAWGLRQQQKRAAIPSIVCPVCSARSYNPKDVEHRYCARCRGYHDDMIRADPRTGVAPDDGEAPPNFVMVPRREYEEYGHRPPQTWRGFVAETLDRVPALITLETPLLTLAVCLVTVACTAAVVLVLWR